MTLKSELVQPRFQRILVAVDGSDSSIAAAGVAIELAKKHGGTLTILNVLYTSPYWVSYYQAGLPPPVEFQDYQKKQADRLIAKVRRMADEEKVEAHGAVLLNALSVVRLIVDYAAKEKIGLIVIGTRGLSGFKKMLLGSVSSGVVTHAPCSVLVVR